MTKEAGSKWWEEEERHPSSLVLKRREEATSQGTHGSLYKPHKDTDSSCEPPEGNAALPTS